MPKLPRLTAQEAEKLLLDGGFNLIRSKGSHRIYFKDGIRVVIPFHLGKILHPKNVLPEAAKLALEQLSHQMRRSPFHLST